MQSQPPADLVGQTRSGTVESIDHSGKGLLHLEGFPVFAEAPLLPGDTVDLDIYRRKRRVHFASVTQVTPGDTARRQPPCQYFGTCGGCSFQMLDEATQRQQKLDNLRHVFRSQDLSQVEIHDVVASPRSLAYRNKMEVTLVEQDGRLTSGLFPFSHRYPPGATHIVPLDLEACLLERPLLRHAVDGIVRALAETDFAALLPSMEDASLAVRCDAAETQVQAKLFTRNVRGTSTQIGSSLERAAESIAKIKGLTGFHWETREFKARPTKIPFQTLVGQPQLLDTLTFGDEITRTFAVSPMAFYQVNPEQMIQLYDAAATALALKPDQRLVELYAGSGTIGIRLSPHVAEVHGVEIVPASATDFQENLRLNNVSNMTHATAAAHKGYKRWVREHGAPDGVILDPPRGGLERPVVEALIEFPVDRLVYVSCNPVTAARDVALLAEGGYTLVTMQPFDMFPQTRHLECIFTLQRES